MLRAALHGFGRWGTVLVESVQRNIEVGEAERIAQKFKQGKSFDLADLRSQLEQVRRLAETPGRRGNLAAAHHDAKAAEKALQEDRRWVGFLIDVVLGKDKDKDATGFDVLELARKRHPNVPAAIMTARRTMTPIMPQNSTRCWYRRGIARYVKTSEMTKTLSSASVFSTAKPVR